MRFIFTVLILAVTTNALGQDSLAGSTFDTQAVLAAHAPQVATFAVTKPARARVFDRKFCAGRNRNGGDDAGGRDNYALHGNLCKLPGRKPVAGAHPSTAKLYGVSFSILGGQLLASAWLRHKTPNGKLWLAPPIVATAGHGLAAALNLRTMHQLGSGQ